VSWGALRLPGNHPGRIYNPRQTAHATFGRQPPLLRKQPVSFSKNNECETAQNVSGADAIEIVSKKIIVCCNSSYEIWDQIIANKLSHGVCGGTDNYINRMYMRIYDSTPTKLVGMCDRHNSAEKSNKLDCDSLCHLERIVLSRTNSNVSELTDDTVDPFCCICQDVLNNDQWTLECGHKLCIKCAQELNPEYNDGDFLEMVNHRCPICREYISTEKFVEIGDRDWYECWEDIFDTDKPDIKSIYRFCNDCGQIFIAGEKSCTENQDNLPNSCQDCMPDEKLDLYIQCPHCKMGWQKDGGCNHMKCCSLGWDCLGNTCNHGNVGCGGEYYLTDTREPIIEEELDDDMWICEECSNINNEDIDPWNCGSCGSNRDIDDDDENWRCTHCNHVNTHNPDDWSFDHHCSECWQDSYGTTPYGRHPGR